MSHPRKPAGRCYVCGYLSYLDEETLICENCDDELCAEDREDWEDGETEVSDVSDWMSKHSRDN